MAVEVYRGSCGLIEFWKERSDWMFYCLSEAEQKKGFDFCMKQLCENEWFDEEARKNFVRVWNMGGHHVR